MPKGRSSLADRRSQTVLDEVFIPDKLYFRIGEVSRLTNTKSYVLRFWETEFPTLRPGKSNTGHRLYRRRDVETVLEIRRLLYGQGFTIEGARKRLADQTGARKQSIRQSQKPLFPSASTGSLAEVPAPNLKSIRRELLGILDLLKRK